MCLEFRMKGQQNYKRYIFWERSCWRSLVICCHLNIGSSGIPFLLLCYLILWNIAKDRKVIPDPIDDRKFCRRIYFVDNFPRIKRCIFLWEVNGQRNLFFLGFNNRWSSKNMETKDNHKEDQR